MANIETVLKRFEEPFQVAQIARGTHQQPQFRALVGQNARDVRAKKSGGACDESFQR